MAYSSSARTIWQQPYYSHNSSGSSTGQHRDWAVDRARQAVDRAGELAVDMPRERRQALDGYLYTAEEFQQHYGEDCEEI